MADTGAPWNIPFVEPTDLVRDYPAADEAQALAVAAGLTAAGNAGIGSNVVQTVVSTTFVTSSTAAVDVTGLSATITPSSDTSRILVLVSALQIGIDAAATQILLTLEATSGASPLSIGSFFDRDADSAAPYSAAVLHSPATNSPVTYQVRVRRVGGSLSVRVFEPMRLVLIEVAP